MMFGRWTVGLGWLAWVGCGPVAGSSEHSGSSEGSESSGIGTTADEESSTDSSDSLPADESGEDDTSGESGESSEPPRCFDLVGLPVTPDETIEGFADLDGDDRRELVIASDTGIVTIFAADAPSGPWTLRQSITAANGVHDIGDVDGDGRDDLVLGSPDGSHWWRTQDYGSLVPERPLGSGWLEDRRVLVVSETSGPASIAEIVDGELALGRGMGDGTFVAASVVASPEAHLSLVEPILRFRGGLLAPARWQLGCLERCSDGHHVVTPAGELAAQAQYAVHTPILDVVRDDDTDIPDAFTLHRGALELHVDGGGARVLADDVDAAQLGDFDGDGILDLASLVGDVAQVQWDARAVASEMVRLPSADPDGFVTPELAVDIDGDGRDELVVGESGRHALVFAQPCE